MHLIHYSEQDGHFYNTRCREYSIGVDGYYFTGAKVFDVEADVSVEAGDGLLYLAVEFFIDLLGMGGERKEESKKQAKSGHGLKLRIHFHATTQRTAAR